MTSLTVSPAFAPITHSISATLASDWQFLLGVFALSLYLALNLFIPNSWLTVSLLQIFFQAYLLTDNFPNNQIKIANPPYTPLSLPILLPFPIVLVLHLFSL